MSHSTRVARTATVFSVVAASALVLAGCATATPAGDAGDLTGTIRILANITPVLTMDYYQGLVAPFIASHPGVKITIESPSGKDVQSTLQQELAAGTTPDIVASNLDAVVAPQMTAFPDEDWVNNTPLADGNKVDGKIWQVATGIQTQSLVYYNETAFDEAGITDLPKSLDEFTADLAKLQAAGYIGLDISGEWATGAQLSMMATPELLGNDPDWFTKRNEKKVTFADSAYATYLQALQGWIETGAVSKDALGGKYQDSIDSFLAGKSATYIMGNWIVASVDQATDLPFKVGVFPTPTIDGSTPKQMGGAAQPYSILKASKNQALDLELVKYLVSDKTAIATSLKSEGNFRAGISYDSSELNTAVATILDDAPGTVPTTTPAVNPGFGGELNTATQSLFTGATAAQVTAELDSWWDANANQ